MAKKKRYFFSVVEEIIMNPRYKDYRGGRIEVYDENDKTGYAIYEARFFIPSEFINSFRETWDFKKSAVMPFIHWDYSEVKNRKKLLGDPLAAIKRREIDSEIKSVRGRQLKK